MKSPLAKCRSFFWQIKFFLNFSRPPQTFWHHFLLFTLNCLHRLLERNKLKKYILNFPLLFNLKIWERRDFGGFVKNFFYKWSEIWRKFPYAFQSRYNQLEGNKILGEVGISKNRSTIRIIAKGSPINNFEIGLRYRKLNLHHPKNHVHLHKIKCIKIISSTKSLSFPQCFFQYKIPLCLSIYFIFSLLPNNRTFKIIYSTHFLIKKYFLKKHSIASKLEKSLSIFNQKMLIFT